MELVTHRYALMSVVSNNGIGFLITGNVTLNPKDGLLGGSYSRGGSDSSRTIFGSSLTPHTYYAITITGLEVGGSGNICTLY